MSLSTTSIEWTDATWNPVTGCTKVSEGCRYCYANRMALRLKAMRNPRYKNGFQVTIHEDLITAPLRWKVPKRIFVNSMSDLFHEKVPLSVIQRIFDTMQKSSWHIFQILTKRPERALKLSEHLTFSPNIWMGTSVESDRHIQRVSVLQRISAEVRFISFEPLLSAIPPVNLSGIHLAIVGGESGPGARTMQKSWVVGLKKTCREYRVAFFFKQWGGVFKKKTGRRLHGRTWDEMPKKKKLAVAFK